MVLRTWSSMNQVLTLSVIEIQNFEIQNFLFNTFKKLIKKKSSCKNKNVETQDEKYVEGKR